jgi:carbamoyltransferase
VKVLGINALFHDPAAALVVDGVTVAAAEEERFSRRKHGKRPVPFAAWELPELAARWCLAEAGLDISDIDAVAYSYDPELARPAEEMGLDDPWDHLRQTYARRAPGFLATSLPGLDPAAVRFVPHHVAHAASAGLASPHHDAADVLVLDGRGESASHLAGRYEQGRLETFRTQELPHSLGLLYETVTEHLGFLRSSDEYKVMALASYGKPRFLEELRRAVYTTGDGGFHTDPVESSSDAPTRSGPRTTPTSPPASSAGSRRSSSSSRDGCRPAPAGTPSRWPAAWRSTAWPTPGSSRPVPTTRSGCSRLPATPARLWAAPSTSPAPRATSPSRCPGRTSAGASATPTSRRG